MVFACCTVHFAYLCVLLKCIIMFFLLPVCFVQVCHPGLFATGCVLIKCVILVFLLPVCFVQVCHPGLFATGVFCSSVSSWSFCYWCALIKCVMFFLLLVCFDQVCHRRCRGIFAYVVFLANFGFFFLTEESLLRRLVLSACL